MYLTRRLKRFRINSNRYLVANAITGEIVVLNQAGIAVLDALATGEQCKFAGRILDDRGLLSEG